MLLQMHYYRGSTVRNAQNVPYCVNLRHATVAILARRSLAGVHGTSVIRPGMQTLKARIHLRPEWLASSWFADVNEVAGSTRVIPEPLATAFPLTFGKW
ncbi:hypothetical protein AVEN_64493-1 [Araneus ventricosus]|uniref:Uncharacterized protein n=1 Tax=Araneus ventricosus TaxID=182803 RepID=A0A4Y2INZ6_ARAVE|nr:hypothetical protein AVEN_64493-1 [Araneus ventricosus]